ncbi:MAG: hypothetical protein ACTSP4_10125 [Candidatus Hodarchaeales archaeon]
MTRRNMKRVYSMLLLTTISITVISAAGYFPSSGLPDQTYGEITGVSHTLEHKGIARGGSIHRIYINDDGCDWVLGYQYYSRDQNYQNAWDSTSKNSEESYKFRVTGGTIYLHTWHYRIYFFDWRKAEWFTMDSGSSPSNMDKTINYKADADLLRYAKHIGNDKHVLFFEVYTYTTFLFGYVGYKTHSMGAIEFFSS